MTVYAKIENNKLITAYNGYNGITGLADSPELCLASGFTAYTEEEISGYFAGTHRIVDGVLIDISQTPEYIAEQAAKRQAEFESNFFLITDFGWYRKVPKGYSSAVESLNTLFNAVSVIQQLPANYITFYTAPNFTVPEQCTDKWLVENSYRNTEMTIGQFALFYNTAITIWNTQEH